MIYFKNYFDALQRTNSSIPEQRTSTKLTNWKHLYHTRDVQHVKINMYTYTTPEMNTLYVYVACDCHCVDKYV